MRLAGLLVLLTLAGCGAPAHATALDVTDYWVDDDGQIRHQFHSGSHAVTCSGGKAVHMLVLTVAGNDWPEKDAWRVHSDGHVSPAMELEYWSSGQGGALHVYGCLAVGATVDELTYEPDGHVQARAAVDRAPTATGP